MKKILCCVLALLLTACFGEHDTDWFREHTKERDDKIALCRATDGAFGKDKECGAAYAAEDVLPVSFWKEHHEERKARVAECKEHSATIGTSGNCANAIQAAKSALGGGAPVYLN